MPRASDDPVAVFDESFPVTVQVDMLRALKSLYPSSYRDTQGLVLEDELRDLYPFIRRGQIEGAIRSVAKARAFSEGGSKHIRERAQRHRGRPFLPHDICGWGPVRDDSPSRFP